MFVFGERGLFMESGRGRREGLGVLCILFVVFVSVVFGRSRAFIFCRGLW